MHLTHLLGKKRNGNQAATGADKEGKERRSARLSPDDIIHGNPARKGAVKGEEELTALPETPLSPLSAQGRKGGGTGHDVGGGGSRLILQQPITYHLLRSRGGPGQGAAVTNLPGGWGQEGG